MTSLPLSPDGMLAHASLSCAHKLSNYPVYGTRSHLAGLSSAQLRGSHDSFGSIAPLQWPRSASRHHWKCI